MTRTNAPSVAAGSNVISIALCGELGPRGAALAPPTPGPAGPTDSVESVEEPQEQQVATVQAQELARARTEGRTTLSAFLVTHQRLAHDARARETGLRAPKSYEKEQQRAEVDELLRRGKAAAKQAVAQEEPWVQSDWRKATDVARNAAEVGLDLAEAHRLPLSAGGRVAAGALPFLSMAIDGTHLIAEIGQAHIDAAAHREERRVTEHFAGGAADALAGEPYAPPADAKKRHAYDTGYRYVSNLPAHDRAQLEDGLVDVRRRATFVQEESKQIDAMYGADTYREALMDRWEGVVR